VLQSLYQTLMLRHVAIRCDHDRMSARMSRLQAEKGRQFVRRSFFAAMTVPMLVGCITMPADMQGRIAEAHATHVTAFGPLRMVVVASFLSGPKPPPSARFVACAKVGKAAVFALGVDCRPEDEALAKALNSVPNALEALLGGAVRSKGLRVLRVDAQFGGQRQERSLAWGELPRMSFLLRDQVDADKFESAAVETVAHELSHLVQHQRHWRIDLDARERSAVWIGRCTALALTGAVSPRQGADMPVSSARSDMDSSLRMAAQADSEWNGLNLASTMAREAAHRNCVERVREYSSPMLQNALTPLGSLPESG
jgi:hypothetical protein